MFAWAGVELSCTRMVRVVVLAAVGVPERTPGELRVSPGTHARREGPGQWRGAAIHGECL